MQRVAFFIIPSVAAFLVLGDSIVALLYQTGKFTRDNVPFVWAVLAGSTIGLLASALGRLYTSAFWALRDTRTPLRFASLRVALTAGLGWFLAFPVPRWLGLSADIGLIGLTASAGIAAWIEFTLLRFSMNRRIGKTGLRASYAAKLWSIAIVAAAVAFAVKYWTKGMPPLVSGPLVLAVFGMTYFGSAAALKIPEALQLSHAVISRFRSTNDETPKTATNCTNFTEIFSTVIVKSLAVANYSSAFSLGCSALNSSVPARRSHSKTTDSAVTIVSPFRSSRCNAVCASKGLRDAVASATTNTCDPCDDKSRAVCATQICVSIPVSTI